MVWNTDPTFGFACPAFAILVPLAVVAWAMNRLDRDAVRRMKPAEDTSS